MPGKKRRKQTYQTTLYQISFLSRLAALFALTLFELLYYNSLVYAGVGQGGSVYFALVLFDAITLYCVMVDCFCLFGCVLYLVLLSVLLISLLVFLWECLSCHFFMLSCTCSCFHVFDDAPICCEYNQTAVYGLYKEKKNTNEIQPPQVISIKILIKHC